MKKINKLLLVFLLVFTFFVVCACKKDDNNETKEPTPTQVVPSEKTEEPIVTPIEKTIVPSEEKMDAQDWNSAFAYTNVTIKESYTIPFDSYDPNTNYYVYNVVSLDEAYCVYYDGDVKETSNKMDIIKVLNLTDLFKDKYDSFNLVDDKYELTDSFEKDGLFVISATIVFDNESKLSKITYNYVNNSKSNTCNLEFSNYGVTEKVELKEDIVHEYVSVTEALALAVEAGEAGTSEEVYVSGAISRITNSIFGEMYITDGTNELYIYGLYDNDLAYGNWEDKPYKGDTVYLYGILKTYNESPEMGKAQIVKFEKDETPVDLTEYTECTISDAREKEADSKVIVSGVVAFVTKANGQVPNGLYLVDNTQSIYVYDVDLAGRVKVGDSIKIAAEKTYYVLESEKDNAVKNGYIGSCQLQSAVLINQESKNLEFDKSWITESTVKEIVEASVSSNVTTTIYKVNAYVNRVPGSGFVNYYINDLDNKTGSYTYSMCNGGDFEYLQEFDGKICTVYLSPINCKSTASGSFFRFIPILVIDENYEFDSNKASEYAITYCVKDQFYNEYLSNPQLEVITSVSNTDLGFENVTVTYTSSDENVIKFETEDDKVIMNVLATGTATITCVASYNDVTYSYTKEISCRIEQEYESITVSEALKVADGNIVQVRGVVSASLVNQTGFYLIDNTGIVAVRVSSETLKLIKLGDEVIVSGTKNHVTKYPDTVIGQICIDNAELVVDLYGNHELNLTNVITNKTINDIISMSNNSGDMTTEYYQVSCYVKKEETQYYTNFYLTNEVNGSNTFSLYSASGSQYSFLNDYVDKEITVILAFCNWNSKTYYKGCVLAVIDGENIVTNNLNFK